MDGNEEYLTDSFSAFKGYLNDYCLLDEHLFRICDKTDLKLFRNWFADANVINAFFAAIGKHHESRADRVQKAIDALKSNFDTSDTDCPVNESTKIPFLNLGMLVLSLIVKSCLFRASNSSREREV